MNNKRAAILLIIGTLCLIFGIKSMSSSRFLGVMLLLIWAGTFTVGLSWFTVGRKYEKNQKAIENSTDLFSYNDTTGVLTLKKRGPELADYFIINADRTIETKYDPVKIHVGAATVGGVTTGGVYTTGGNYNISSAKKNGRYTLRCKYGGGNIGSIVIPKEEIKNAVNSPISKYLSTNKTTIEVIEAVSYTQEERDRFYSNVRSSYGMHVDSDILRKQKQGYPTYEKCIEIKKWLCMEN